MRGRNRTRGHARGVALLEVLVAIVVLAGAGVGFVELAIGGTRALRAARERGVVLADEHRLLAAHALLTRADLNIRLGVREVGPYLVSVDRRERTLYRIAISRLAAPDVEDLVTVVFRRELEVQETKP